MRTIPGSESQLEKLDQLITKKLIRNLLNPDCSDLDPKLLSLPVKVGGLGINTPSGMSKI